MKELKIKEVRRKMYSEYQDKKKEDKLTAEGTIVRSTQDTVLIESQGQKQFVPNMAVFTKLTNEHEKLKSDHNKAVKEINVLNEAVKNLIRAVNEMDDELKRKIDLPDVS